MTKQKKAARHVGRAAVFSLGNLAFLVGQFVLLTLVARFGGPLLLGAYGLSMALLNPLFFLANFGMRRAQAVDVADRFSFSTYKKSRNYLLSAAFVLALFVLAVLPDGAEVKTVFIILLIAKIADSLCDLEYGFLLRQTFQHHIGISFLWRGAASVVLYLGIYLLTRDAMWSLLALPASWLCVYYFHDRRHRLEFFNTPVKTNAPENTAQLLLHLWPLALSDALIQFQQSFPRLAVEQVTDLATLGALVPGFQGYMLVLALGNSVTQSILPHLANRMRAQATTSKSGDVMLTMALAVPLFGLSIFVSYLMGPTVISVVFGAEYGMSGDALGLLSIAWSFRLLGVILQNYSLAAGRFGALLKVHIAVTVLHVGAVTLLLQAMGLDGIFVGLIIGNMSFFLIMAFRMLKDRGWFNQAA